MPHNVPLITTLAAALGLALVFGFAAARLRLPAVVGYLVAGIVIGPATPGFDADLDLALQLAEVGVMLLMFGVGLHFSLGDLLAVRRIALPGAVVQIVVATALGATVAAWWGWSLPAGIVFGLALSVASTVVLLKSLEMRGLIDSINGRIAVGWLVVEDLVTVLVLVLMPPLSSWLHGGDAAAGVTTEHALLFTFLRTIGAVALFLALMLVIGRRIFPQLLWQVARTGSRELFTLCVIAAAVGIAYGAAALFGVSFALGAFFAGMVLRESALSHRAAAESLPLRDAFSVLFFVSVGMLFDPAILIEEPVRVLGVVAIIVIGKTIAAFLIVIALRYPFDTALTVSASLAQIGEFSFILAGLGISLGLLPLEAQSLILAGALISIALNPLVFSALQPLQSWLHAHSRLVRVLEQPTDPLAELPMTIDQSQLTGHVVLAGYGEVGRRIGEALIGRGVHVVVAEQNRELVEQLRVRGIAAVYGDATEAAVLIQSHIARAQILVVTLPDPFGAGQMIEIARTLKPDVEVVVRAPNEDAAALLRKVRATACVGEHELALGMARHVLTLLDEAARDEQEPAV